jgi:adenylate cyclase
MPATSEIQPVAKEDTQKMGAGQQPASVNIVKRQRTPRLITIRTSLLLAMLSLVILIALASLAALQLSAARLVRQVSSAIIAARTVQVEAQLAAYFKPVEVALNAAENTIFTDKSHPVNPAALIRYFAPVSAALPQAGVIKACDVDGNYASLQFGGEAWISCEARPSEWNATLHYASRASLDAAPSKQWTQEQAADPRLSHWYKGAMDAEAANNVKSTPPQIERRRVHWTEAYQFATVADPGITASRLIMAPDNKACILAIDILVASLDEFTDNLRPTPHGYVVVTDRGGRLLEPQSSTEDEEDKPDPKHSKPADDRAPIETDESLMQDAFDGWAKIHGHEFGTPVSAGASGAGQSAPLVEHETFQFKSKGRLWWGGLESFALGTEPEFNIAVLIPEADLISELQSQRQVLLLIAAIALLLAAGLAMSIAAAFSAPIVALAKQSDGIRRLELEGYAGSTVRSQLLEVAKLSLAQASMHRALDSFARYVPIDLVRDLLERGEAARIGGRLLPLTILITDIRNFTSISEALRPEDLAKQLAEYFDCILGVLHEGGATIDKLVGDSVIAFWGAPQPAPAEAGSVVACVLQAMAGIQVLNARWKAEGKPALPTHAGLTFGEVVVGNIGAHWRLNYTAMGDAVNLASRLEKLNPLYGTEIIAAPAIKDACGPEFAWRLLDRVAIRGKQAPVAIYEPLGPALAVTPQRMQAAQEYEKALQLMWDRRFTEAQTIASTQLGLTPGDRSLKLLLQRTTYYISHPPPWNWDGVYREREQLSP